MIMWKKNEENMFFTKVYMKNVRMVVRYIYML